MININKRFKSVAEAQEYVRTLSMTSIEGLLVALLLERQNGQSGRKIMITEEMFNAHFRIVGRKEDGSEERRGRPRKTEE